MLSKSIDISFPTFSGKREDAPKHRIQVLMKLSTLSPHHIHGLVGLFLSDKEFECLENVDLPFERLKQATRTPRPSRIMKQVRKVWEENRIIWDAHDKKVIAEESVISATKLAFWNSLDLNTQNFVCDGDELLTISCSAMLASYDKRFMPDPEDIKREHNKLTEPHTSGDDVEAFISKHVTTHKFLAKHGEYISDARKITLLSTALSMNHSEFHDILKSFDRLDTTSQTFAHLRQCVEKEARGVKHITARAAGYAHLASNSSITSASVIDPSIARLDAKLDAATARIDQALAAMGKKWSPKPTQSSVSASSTQQTPTHYCWSCGHKCLHPSYKCPSASRKVGHQDKATAANTMGGH